MARTDTVRDWLKALGVLTAANMSPADAKAKIAAYTPMVASEFGDYCFTTSSLAAVAKASKFFPTYGELAKSLSEWARDHRPPGAYDKPRLAGPAPRSERDEAAHDRQWWDARIDAIAAMDSPTLAWREAVGMRSTLFLPLAVSRPWAVSRLDEIMRNCEAAGADTDLSMVVMARNIQRPRALSAKAIAA